MRASNHFFCNIFWQFVYSKIKLVTVVLFLTLISFGCKKDTEVVKTLPDTTEFKQLAKSFVDKAQLQVKLNDITLASESEIQDLENIAREVIDEMVFIKTDSSGTLFYNKVKDGTELTENQKDDAAQKLIDEGLIAKGDYLVKVEWFKENGQPFYTLGVMAANGKPKFEPILHYNGIVEVDVPHPMHRGWDWGPFRRTVQNGFGITCVEVEFKVHIATDPANCMIVDPGPHIEITKAISNCVGWEQETTKGETNWCNPRPQCECRYGSNFPAEECIKFVVVTYVATGFSDIEIEAGAKGEYKGIELEAKIKMNASRFGAEAIFETIRSICASGSTP